LTGAPGQDNLPDGDAAIREKLGQTADVIVVNVTHDHRIDASDALMPQIGTEDPVAGPGRAAVDEDRVAVRQSGEDGVALAHVEEGHRGRLPSAGRGHGPRRQPTHQGCRRHEKDEKQSSPGPAGGRPAQDPKARGVVDDGKPKRGRTDNDGSEGNPSQEVGDPSGSPENDRCGPKERPGDKMSDRAQEGGDRGGEAEGHGRS
jgi:hypothetical protein